MKYLIFLLLTLSGGFAFSGITTALEIPAPPSDANIKRAIKLLQQSLKTKAKPSSLALARKLISMQKKPVVFRAAIYVNNNKQFNHSGDEATSWDFSSYCYKGALNEAVTLINKALELGYWDSDEEWISGASGRDLNIILKISGSTEWEESFTACR